MKARNLLFLISFFLLAIPCHVFADSSDDARRFIETANDDYQRGAFRSALTNYQKAYRLTSDANVLYRVGLTYEQLLNFQRAREALEGYIAARPNADYIDRIRKKVAVLREKESTEQAYVSIASRPSGATVIDTANGRAVGTTPLKLPVGPGEHLFRLELNEHASVQTRVFVQSGEQVKEDVELRQIQGAVEREVPVVISKPATPSPTVNAVQPHTFGAVTVVDFGPPVWSQVLSYIGFGVGTTMLMFGFLSQSDVSEFRDLNPTLMYGVGAGLIGVSGYFLWFHPWSATVSAEDGSSIGLGLRTAF